MIKFLQNDWLAANCMCTDGPKARDLGRLAPFGVALPGQALSVWCFSTNVVKSALAGLQRISMH